MDCKWMWRCRIGRALLVVALVWGLAAPGVASAAPQAAMDDEAGAPAWTLSQAVDRLLQVLGLGGEPPVPAAPPVPEAPEDGGVDHQVAPYGPLIDPNGFSAGPRTQGGPHRP